METIILELRAAEGGDDAKLLVKDMASMYLKAASIYNFSSKVLTSVEGFTSI